jgi:hypothetical protein
VSDSNTKSELVSTESPRSADGGPCGKPGRSGPPGNRNAKKHGLYAGDARRIDMRTREDKAVFQTLRAIEEDLADLSAQKRLILDGIGRKLRDLFKLEAYIGGLSSIVNKRARALLPAVVEKHRLLESIRRDLESVGLERRSRELKLADYLGAKKGGEAPSASAMPREHRYHDGAERSDVESQARELPAARVSGLSEVPLRR